MEFEWDSAKEKSNLRKHQVGFSEAKTVFGDPLALTVQDPTHSFDENRFLSMGRSEADRLIVVSYTERHGDMIRIISARLASRKERRKYEQGD